MVVKNRRCKWQRGYSSLCSEAVKSRLSIVDAQGQGLTSSHDSSVIFRAIKILIFVSSLLMLAPQVQAAVVSGTVWNDISSDTYMGLGSTGSLGDNVLEQGDTSQTGDLGNNIYGHPVVTDAGIEAGFEGVLLCVTGANPVNCTTTNVDGSYSLDVPTGGTITVTAPSGYKFSSTAPSGDNDADEQSAAPAPGDLWTGLLTDAGGDVGLRPVPEIVLGLFDTNGDSSDGTQGVITGTADWNTLGNCGTTSPYEDPSDGQLNTTTDAGDDCHKYDDTVRTNDTVQIVPTIKIDNAPDGGIDNVVLEVQLFPVNGAVLAIDSPSSNGLPVGCKTGAAYNPQSEVITNADGSVIVICNIGSVENGQEFRTISVVPTGDSPNGSSFTTEMKSYAGGNDAVPSEEPDVNEINISSAPRFDLTKNKYSGLAGADGGSAQNTVGSYAGVSLLNNVTNEVEQGVRMVHQISIMAEDGVGASALGDSFTFKEFVDSRYAAFGARVVACTPTITSSWVAPINGNGNLPYLDNATVDNGSYSCATDGSDPTNTITINNADTSGAHYPTEGANGTSTSPHNIVVTGQISVWYPYSAFYRFAGPDKVLGTADDGLSTDPNDTSLWAYGDDPVFGTYSTTNCVGDFDPNSVDAFGNPVSNYGNDHEPGHISSTEADGNNCRNVSFTVSATGSFTKRYGGAWYLDESGLTTDRHRYYNMPNYGWACTGEPDRLVVPGQTSCSSGDGPIVATQLFTSSLVFHAGASAVDLSMPTMCETIDNSTYKLSKIPAGTTPAIPTRIVGEYAFYVYNDTALPSIDSNSAVALGYEYADDHGFYLEYARFSQTPAQVQWTWQIDHAAGLANTIDGTIPVNNDQQQLAAKDCGEALTASGELEWSLDPDSDGWDIGDVVMVRMRANPGVVIQAGDYSTNLHMHFEARENFYSPSTSEHGQPIPLGTLLPNVANRGWDSDDDGVVNYGTGGYDATDHSGSDGATTVAYGDRLIFQTVSVAINKQAYDATELGGSSVVGADDTSQVFVGDPVMWSLHPSVNSVNNIAVAKDVTITDVLPLYVSYAPSCTPALPAGITGPVVQPDTPSAGETTLTWAYDDDLTANQALEPISVCTLTDAFAPANPALEVVNNVVITASNVAYSSRNQEDERAVNMVQIGRFAVKKSVDFPLDFQNQEQEWTLIWANRSDEYPFAAPDIIDVFPWVGDGVGSLSERENYESDFAGTLELTAIPAVPTVVTGAGGTRVEAGQWYASCEAPGNINHDPTDASNAFPSTTWTPATASTTNDPSASCLLADVTALRWVSTTTLAALDTVSTTVILRADNNESNDVYVNRFVGYTSSFTDAVRSNEPYVQIIGFSIGDLIWLDVDGNDIFDQGSDVTAAGINVSLYDESGLPVSGIDGATTKTTDADGRWFFEGVVGEQHTGPGTYVAGKYYVVIDNLPQGWKVDGTSVTFVADPNNDENESSDHHTLLNGTAIQSSSLMELSAVIDAAGLITGAEPKSDNVNILGDPLIRDDLTNFTLDLMLVPSRGDIRIVKEVEGGGPDLGWEFTVSSVDSAGCPLPSAGVNATFVNPASTDATGEAIFEDLLVYNTSDSSLCEYNITETAMGGWTQTAVSPAGPYQVTDGGVLRVEFTNTRDTGDIVVTKTVVGADAPVGWEFTLSSLTTGCDISSITNPATTTDGSGGDVTFSGVPTHSDTDPFETCGYEVTETAQTGWTQTTDATDLTGLTVVANADTEVAITNVANVLQAQVTKSVTGIDTTLDWSFGFSLTTTGAINPVLNTDEFATGTGATTSSDVVSWTDIQPGQTYVLTEIPVDGYIAGTMQCAGVVDTDSVDNTVTFVAPATDDLDPSAIEIDCTISNNASLVQAQITKTVEGVDDSFDWSFEFALTPTLVVAPTLQSSDRFASGTGSITATDVVSWGGLIPGAEYVLSEVASSDFIVSSDLVCDGLNDSDNNESTVTFIAPLGDTDTSTFEVTCSITNQALSSDVVVTKTVSTNDTSDWSFDFTLTPAATIVEASPVTGNGSGAATVSWSDLVPGTEYTLAEVSSSGYAAGALTCTGLIDTDGNVDDASITFVAPIGDANTPAINFEVVCAITNQQWPNVVVTKTVTPEAIVYGETITYSIEARNDGIMPATGVELTDVLPDGVSITLATPSAGTTFDIDTGIWTVGTLQSAVSATLSLTANIEPLAGVCAATYTNTVSVTSQGESDFDALDNDDSAIASLISLGLAKRLSDSSPVELGDGRQLVTYEFVLMNTSDQDISKLQIVDNLDVMIATPNPNEATYEVTEISSSNMTLTPNLNYDGSRDQNILSGEDTLVAGASGNVSITFVLTPDVYFGPFINSATASGETVSGVLVSDLSENGDTITIDSCNYDEPTPLELSTPSTPITLGWFQSEHDGNSIRFDWETEVEVSNAGFNIAVQSEDGEWVVLNEDMIVSSGDSTEVQSYSFLANNVDGNLFRFIDVSVTGTLQYHGPFVLGQEYGVKSVHKKTDWEGIREESEMKKEQRQQEHGDKLQQQLQQLKNQSSVNEQNVSEGFVHQSLDKKHGVSSRVSGLLAGLLGVFIAPAEAVEIVNFEIEEAGIYRVSHADLLNVGLDLTGFEIPRIGLRTDNELAPVNIYTAGSEVFTSSSYIEFPAHAKQTLYSGVNRYTLVLDEGQSLIEAVDTDVPYKGAATSYLAESSYAEQNRYTHLSPDENDAWYADRLTAISGPANKVVTLKVVDQANSLATPFSGGSIDSQLQGVQEKPTLNIRLWGASSLPGNGITNPDHHVLVKFNGVNVADETFDGLRVHDVSVPLAQTPQSTNTVNISLPRDHGYQFDIINLDSVSLTYPRKFVAENNGQSLVFSSAWDKFRINSLASDDIVVYRTDPSTGLGFEMIARGTEPVDQSTCVASDCMVVFSGSDVSTESQYYVATQAGIKEPTISIAPPQEDLFDGQASVLIISHPDFINTSTAILETYASELAVIYGSADIVSTESIYAQYSGHVPDSGAIAAYVADGYELRNSRHLILVGGDTYDYHNHGATDAQSFVPSIYVQIAQNINSVPSDAKYADVDGDFIPDMTVTRLPVRTAQELTTLMTKRMKYIERTYRSNVLFAADENDSSSYSFEDDSDSIISDYFNGSQWSVSRAYMTENSSVTQDLINGINAGASITSFFGHSSTDRWSISGMFTGNDAANLMNTNQPTVVTQWGCWNTFYVSPSEDSMAHRLLVEGAQGAVTVMGASSLTKAGAEKRMAELLFENLTQRGMRIGDAVLAAKRSLAEENPYQLDILLGWAVLGPSDMQIN